MRGGVIVPFLRMDCGFSAFLLDNVRRPLPDFLRCEPAAPGELLEIDLDEVRLGW